MSVLEGIKENIHVLYESNPDVHVNVAVKSPRRMTLENLPVTIKGVYPNMFQIEDRSGRIPRQFTHLYTDIITKDIEIHELTCNIDQNIEQRKGTKQQNR